jgi:hypothetical protein
MRCAAIARERLRYLLVDVFLGDTRMKTYGLVQFALPRHISVKATSSPAFCYRWRIAYDGWDVLAFPAQRAAVTYVGASSGS